MKLKSIFIYIGTCVVAFLIVIGIMFLINLYKANKMIKDFDKTFASSDKQIVFYARETCYFCQMQKPILKQIAADYNLKYLDIDSDMLSEKQKNHIIDTLGIDGSTPVTAIVKNNNVLNIHTGYLDGKEYVDFLIDSGMLPKKAIYKPEKNLKYITYNDFLNLNEGILVVGKSASPDCIDLRKSLNNIAAKYQIDINYLNLSNGTEEEYYDIMSKLDSYNVNGYKYKKDGNLIIPTIFGIKDSKIDFVIKDIDENKIVEILKKNKIIK